MEKANFPKYYLLFVYLDGCPYSKTALQTLENFNVKYKKIIVHQDNKEKYKNNDIATFPQIYMVKRRNKDSLLLGGYDTLKEFVDTFIGKKITDKEINYFLGKNMFWSKHTILRLIELFLQKY
jgi:glutaredoxin